MIPIDSIKKNPQNPRVIKDQKFKKLVNSIKEFPKMMELRPMVVDKDGIVLGGNMRLEAIKSLGMTEIPDTWVKRAEDLSPEEIRRFIAVDNASFGEWDMDALANLYEVAELDAWGLDDLDLPKLEGDTEEDDAPAVSSEPPKSVKGSIYQLGNHRLMCGDATNFQSVSDLMNGVSADMVFTDPPYGVSYAEKNKALNAISPANRIQVPIENDHKSVDEMFTLWKEVFTNIKTASKDGFSYYICSPQRGELMMMMMMALRDSGIPVRHTLIWAKNNFVLGRADYHYQHEPILYGWGTGTHTFYGDRSQTSIWNIDKPLKSELHPTMKPVELVAKALRNSSKDGDIVLDLFGGSGSTLIACEQLGRKCYMMELDPHYVDVIRKRWAKFVYPDTWEERWEELTPEITN